MPTYTYNPDKISENGVDRMRFELGDTTFNPGELTAALSDEEYSAVIGMYDKWKRAKLAALEAILMKFAHQCTFTVGPVSYSFSERVKTWQALYDNLKNNLSSSMPPSSSMGNSNSGKPYFFEDMHENPRKG